MKIFRLFKLLLLLLLLFPSTLYCQTYFRVMEWNVENLFDTVHDSLKNDNEFLPNSMRHWNKTCLLYTSDAADELDGVDLGGRRIIKKKRRRECRSRW